MKKTSSSATARATLSALFLITSVALFLLAIFVNQSKSANPASGTLNPVLGTSVSWDGTATGGTVGGDGGGDGNCTEGQSCDTYTLTLTGAPADWAGKKVEVVISWTATGVDDYDLYIHKNSNAGAVVNSSAGFTSPETASFEPSATGTGDYTAHVIYYTVVDPSPPPTGTGQYHGTATVVAGAPPTGTPPPAPQDTGAKIGYENFEPPGTLINVTSSSQGPSAATVEYLGRDAGEPSIGVNWQSTQDTVKGITAFQADLQTLFVKFDDSCPANGQSAIWYNSQAPSSQLIDSDPIGFTDRITGRTFAGQLTLTSPECKISFTDTDGLDPLQQPGPQGWFPPSTGPAGAGIDHETIGGGPYHASLVPLPPLPPPAYQHAVYYASQDLVTAFCLLSVNGGANFGPTVPMYDAGIVSADCGGLHGHIKVTPKTAATMANGQAGTVYVPNNDCSGLGAVVVSEDNNTTWTIRPVPQTANNPNLQDPAVAVDDAGRVYFAMSSRVPGPTGDSQAVVATSVDRGQTWQNIYDVGAIYGLKNIAFPAAAAGTAGRAAVAFYGSTTGGDGSANSFTGIWHLYVAHTFDGGLTWTTSDATPNDPLQRGCIWMHGGADICRNLLDFFDMTIDKEGRVQVGYVDGCVDGHCVQAASTAKGNAYTARTVIARQSSGRRMLASFSTPATEAPGMPLVTARRIGSVVRLSWSEADTGNSTITSYKVFRRDTGATTLLATLSGTQTSYTDSTATNINKTYYYKVVAANAVGSSCPNNEVAAPYVGDTCTGLIVQKTPPGHPEQSAHGSAPASLAIDYITVGEPPGTSDLMFKMNATSLASVPPSSRWRIVWNSYAAQSYDPAAQQFYVGMTTDANSNVTFEYGTVATAVLALVIGVPTETELASVPNNSTLAGASTPSTFNANGTISIFIPKSAVGNPQPGDLLGAVNGRTFTGDTSETENLERSTLLVDHTFVKAQRDNGHPAATYTVFGNVACGGTTPNPVTCSGTTVEDDNPHIAYSNGWHLIKNSSASAGHFRLNEGGNNIHYAILTFDDTALTGSVTYFYATSLKGGSAEVFLDGVDMGPVSYVGPSGSNRSPAFGASKSFSYGPTMGGHHTLEIRPIHDGVYIDAFCLPTTATLTGSPAAHPGATSESLATQSAGQALLSSITLPAGTQAISIAAEPSVAAPIQLVLIDPSGAVLQTANSSTGVVVLEAPITQSGVYTNKEVNLSLGPVQIWSVATPLVSDR
jgi:hypothetical protein